MEGDQWKYGDGPELAEVQKHKAARSRLLLMIPLYQIPVEGYISDTSPNGEFCHVNSGFMNAWFPISEIRILDILPKVAVTPRNAFV